MDLRKLVSVRSVAITIGFLLAAAAVAAAAVPYVDYGSLVRVSVSSAGVEANGGSGGTSVSRDGRLVAFSSDSANLMLPILVNGNRHVYVRDMSDGAVTIVSVSSAGTQGNSASSGPVISANGARIAWASNSTNLVSGDGNAVSDVFVRELASGTTTRASVSSTGTEGNGQSYEVGISASGRYVVFESSATNLVAGDDNDKPDVFLRDLVEGTTTLISVSTAGAQANGTSWKPVVSEDGEHVAFYSDATNLVGTDSNGAYDVFVRDLEDNTTTRVSVSSDGVAGTSDSYEPVMTPDGRYIAFYSYAPNLVGASDTNGVYDVFRHDMLTGTTTRASVSSTGTEGNGSSEQPAISDDGRYVTFHSTASNLVGGGEDSNGRTDIFVRDMVAEKTVRVSVSTGGTQGENDSYYPVISADGQYVAFESEATTLVSEDHNGVSDVFVRNLVNAWSAIYVTSDPATLASYGATYSFTGRLAGFTGLVNKAVNLQWSAAYGGPWTDTSAFTLTGENGLFTLNDIPRIAGYYRIRFTSTGHDYASTFSDSVRVVPQASIGNPIAPSSMKAGSTKTVYGYLKPLHTAGTRPVRIYKYRYVSGHWRSYGYVTAKASNYSYYTKYTASVKLSQHGRWRLRAYHPADAGQPAKWSSGYDYVTAK
jgi:hypothetical protein